MAFREITPALWAELELELELPAIPESLEGWDDNVFAHIDPVEPLQLMNDNVTSFPKRLLDDPAVIALAHQLLLDPRTLGHADRIAKGIPATRACATNANPRTICVGGSSKGMCMHPGCTTKAHVRGLCTKHGGCTKIVCVHPDCSTKAQAHGLCFKHRPVVRHVKDEKYFLKRFMQTRYVQRSRKRAKLQASLYKAVSL
jgi:hypothetical protein